ncbi:Cell wall-associated hydrolase, NlpC family [Microbispora rosea]|uniref:Cell wall-associated hydrolase, NlpC family n=1 Tax=Microbispora rosea TaxID=58117 RepID=A0A1N7GIV6_9ACTN|nr:bifunctional lytic transglycosylase/C40 family peptidase [Microbispora rosea]GIH51663.1 hydrolase Nlp/P60 [Microbispora rosea subsp. rosea]SIS12459.1 Cell wall-associated hydrolase, NlpC family [Microbispora rosea]
MGWRWAGAAAAAVALPLLIVVFVFAQPPVPADGAEDAVPSHRALSDIPPSYMRWYMDAAQTCPGLSWTVLAAVGKVESDHGRDPASRRPNTAGARGPMQFLPATFAAYTVDGNGDGRTDVYDPADAIPTAAACLCASGAATDIRKALFAYNHAGWYVDRVLAKAAEYGTAVSAVAGDLVEVILAYARRQIGKPYIWGGTGPDGYDCSGIVYMAYKAAGVTIPRTTFGQWPFGVRIPAGQEQPGDLVFFSSGPGNAPDRPGHVALVIGGGKAIEARCTKCGPIKITAYGSRRNIVGFTRPLANRKIEQQLSDSPSWASAPPP